MIGETIKIGRNKTVNILKQLQNLGGSFHGKKKCLVGKIFRVVNLSLPPTSL